MAEKLRIDRAVIVEGRDDTTNLKRAVDCYTIETHGFGITGETYMEIGKAYERYMGEDYGFSEPRIVEKEALL